MIYEYIMKTRSILESVDKLRKKMEELGLDENYLKKIF